MILVDRPIWPAHGRHFAHLVSDTSHDELHRFATELGLPARAFHRDHYDLPDEWWEQAIAAGAVEVGPRELARRLKAAGLRRRPGPAQAEGAPSTATGRVVAGASPEAQAFQKAR